MNNIKIQRLLAVCLAPSLTIHVSDKRHLESFDDTFYFSQSSLHSEVIRINNRATRLQDFLFREFR